VEKITGDFPPTGVFLHTSDFLLTGVWKIDDSKFIGRANHLNFSSNTNHLTLSWLQPLHFSAYVTG